MFAVEAGERVCLIGRNGAGKSTTLKLIMGTVEPDEGRIERPGSLRTSVLEQGLAEASSETVLGFVAAGMADQLNRIVRYEQLTGRNSSDSRTLHDIEVLETEIIAGGGWSTDKQVKALGTQLDLPMHKRLDELSGGWRRRVALARALVSNPELLLLDEPTNHLDISTIEWLENEITHFAGAVLFVTHDRSFVEHVATRIVDIDRGELRSWPGSYEKFVRLKAKAATEEDQHNKQFDKKLAEEEAWIRQGVKARETRNEGRVRTLEGLREERSQRIARSRSAKIHINESEDLSGRKVIEAHNITHGYGDELLLKDFSLQVMRGDRIGIIGNNGVGKSTLLKILLGELEPQSGSVKLGTNLEVSYFDQLRRELDTSKTVAELIGEGRDYISIGGNKKHVVAYLTDFLFSAKRARTRIAALSGGERNRVILAKLFTRAANLLILDEPTNDLDVETLEALEERLRAYSGTLIIVSHDRHFLDAVVTSTLVFEADGIVKKYAGGYSDWVSHRHSLALGDEAGVSKAAVAPPARKSKESTSKESTSTKLSYKLRRELDSLPAEIAKLESLLEGMHAEIAAPDFYKQSQARVQARLQAMTEMEHTLEQRVERWAELEEQAVQSS
jgi:ATP-binding cassette subfamily F protein uup